MDVCIVENNIIVNVVVLPDGADPAAFGCKPLPHGKWIGDEYDSAASQEKRIAELEEENKTLKAQLELQDQKQTFLEDCLLEMGDVVYA